MKLYCYMNSTGRSLRVRGFFNQTSIKREMKRVIQVLFLIGIYNLQAQVVENNYEILNSNVNTAYQDYGLSFYGDNRVVFASTRRLKSIKTKIWPGNKQPYLQVYEGMIDSTGSITDVKLFEEGINTKYHDADLAFTKDLKTVYFTSNNYLNKKFKRDSLGWNNVQLYKAEVDSSGVWSNVEALPFNNDNYQTGHPSLSSDERTLYFTSDMPGGYGLTDIYKVSINPDGSYGDPINLGPNVNTIGKEMFPHITALDYLFFSSDGYENGRGGLDVYVTRDFGTIVKPSINIGSPINTSFDDFSFKYQHGKKTGYFSSNRIEGKGDDDIYAFTEIAPLLIYYTQFVTGDVTDEKTGVPVLGSEVIVYDDNGVEVKRGLVYGEMAEYSFELDADRPYKVVATKNGYSEDSKEFYLEYGQDQEIPLKIGKEDFIVERKKCLIHINPIYFDFDKSNIREDASVEMNKVAEVMNNYPELIIEVGSHTDSRGSDSYNIRLSDRRAKSTLRYLIAQGIDANRLSSKGYGERQLANDCEDGVKCTEDEHQFNRRTEFFILNYNEIKTLYPSICNIKTISAKQQIETEQESQEN